VFWTSGCALLKRGQNKEKAAEYIKALTYDKQIWKDSIMGTKSGHPGHLPPYKSIRADWKANKPDWMPEFVELARSQLDKAKAINNHLFGLQQFVIGKPIWEPYLKGQEPIRRPRCRRSSRPSNPRSRRADRTRLRERVRARFRGVTLSCVSNRTESEMDGLTRQLTTLITPPKWFAIGAPIRSLHRPVRN
jgi:hypothetical protein